MSTTFQDPDELPLRPLAKGATHLANLPYDHCEQIRKQGGRAEVIAEMAIMTEAEIALVLATVRGIVRARCEA